MCAYKCMLWWMRRDMWHESERDFSVIQSDGYVLNLSTWSNQWWWRYMIYPTRQQQEKDRSDVGIHAMAYHHNRLVARKKHKYYPPHFFSFTRSTWASHTVQHPAICREVIAKLLRPEQRSRWEKGTVLPSKALAFPCWNRLFCPGFHIPLAIRVYPWYSTMVIPKRL